MSNDGNIVSTDFENAGWRDASPLIRIGAAKHALDEAIKDARNSGVTEHSIEVGKHVKPDVWDTRGDTQIWYEIHCGNWVLAMTTDPVYPDPVTRKLPDRSNQVHKPKWYPEKLDIGHHFQTQMEAMELIESDALPPSPVGRGGPMCELVQCTLTIKILNVTIT